MTKDIDVLGIGNAIMDIIAPVPDAFLTANKIERGSMTLIDEPRALDLNATLKSAGELREIAGGSAANTMVGIAELGIRAGYVGKVGRDDVGERLIAGYRDAGVQFETAPTAKTTASARCMIAVTPDGQRSMSTYLGANSDFGTADISKTQIARAKTIYLEGYLFDSDEQKAAYVRAAEYAQATGGLVALTLSDSFCVGRHRAGFRQLSECVTRGEKGSIIQTDTRRYLIPAAPIKEIVDTTGAGDQYAAPIGALRNCNIDVRYIQTRLNPIPLWNGYYEKNDPPNSPRHNSFGHGRRANGQNRTCAIGKDAICGTVYGPSQCAS